MVLTKLHAGGKFDKGAYKVSGGLHGVGVSVVNALSEYLEVEIKRGGKVYSSAISAASRRPRSTRSASREQRGTKVTFKPDPLIFETTDFSFDILSQRLRELAFLNRGVRHHDPRRARRRSRTSSSTKAASTSSSQHLNRAKTPIHPDVIYLHGTREGVEIEVALQWNEGYAENVYAFANNINTIEGGTHLIGLQGGAHAHDQRLRRRQRPAQEGRRERCRARTSARG